MLDIKEFLPFIIPLAAKILATSDEALLTKLKEYSRNLKESVQKKDERLSQVGYKNY